MCVLACDRNGCYNVMCDYYSFDHGYLCWEGMKELKGKGMCDIGAFMNEPKKSSESSEAWEKYVETVFKNRYEEY